MLDSVLRVFGEEFDVDSFLNEYPIQAHTESFRKGEPDLLGNPNSESGFDALLSENENPAENLREIQKFIENHENTLSHLKKSGVNCIVDIGFTVGSSDQFTQSICVPPELLGIFHRFNISIEIFCLSWG